MVAVRLRHSSGFLGGNASLVCRGASMAKGLTWCFAALMMLSVTACGDSGGALPLAIEALHVTPATGRIPAGMEQQLLAQTTLSDGSEQKVASDGRVNWSSSDTLIAIVDEHGLVTGRTPGRVIITASGLVMGDRAISVVTHTATLDVTDAHVAALRIVPSVRRVPIGRKHFLSAMALLSDGSAVDVTHFTGLVWHSHNDAVATVTREGVVTGTSSGNVDITAAGSANGAQFSATTELTVTRADAMSLRPERRF